MPSGPNAAKSPREQAMALAAARPRAFANPAFFTRMRTRHAPFLVNARRGVGVLSGREATNSTC